MTEGPESGVEAWNEITDVAEAEEVDVKEVCRNDIGDTDYSVLRSAASDAGLEFDGNPDKTGLKDAMAEAHIFRGNVGDESLYKETDGSVEKLDIGADADIPPMSESESASEMESSLDDHPYGDLMNLARSAREQFESVDIDTDAPRKDELIQALSEYEPEGSRGSGWTVEVDGDREDVDLLSVQTPENQGSGSAGPSDKTILYCLTRAETTDERVEMIRESLESQTDFKLREASGDKYSIVLPAEAQDGYVEDDDDEDDDESEDSDDSNETEDSSEDESGDSDDSESEEEETEEEEEESAEEESESADEEEEDEEETEAEDEAEEGDEDGEDDDDDEEVDESDILIDYEVAKENLENKNKDEVYAIAVDEEIDGRSDMSKDELIEEVLDNRVGEKIAPPA